MATAEEFERAGGMTATLNPKHQVPCSELHERYTEWCREIEARPLGKRAFSQSLEELGIGRNRTSDTRFYTGVRVPVKVKPVKPERLLKGEDGYFVAPPDLPEEYREQFNETIREYGFSFYQAQGLLASYRLVCSGDQLNAEIRQAKRLQVKNRHGDIRSLPLLDTYLKHMGEVGTWYQVLGLVGVDRADAEDN